MEVKQVIIIRKDLKNKDGHKIKTGKLIAQGAHASLKVFLDDGLNLTNTSKIVEIADFMADWMRAGFTKIVLACESEEELLKYYDEAQRNKLPSSLIRDAARTEFEEPTFTCIAIGPGPSKKIDKIVGHLKTY